MLCVFLSCLCCAVCVLCSPVPVWGLPPTMSLFFCLVMWGVFWGLCVSPLGALGLLGLTEPQTGTSTSPAVPPASARCPSHLGTPGLPARLVLLDRCVGIRRSSRLPWTGLCPLLRRSRPLTPEDSPTLRCSLDLDAAGVRRLFTLPQSRHLVSEPAPPCPAVLRR